MSFSQVDLSIAKPEELFQRLAYVNSVAKHEVVYDAFGNAHQLLPLFNYRWEIFLFHSNIRECGIMITSRMQFFKA